MAASAGPDGGRYEAQLRETAALVAAAAAPDLPWDLVWQSRSGPPQVPWLEPDVNDHLAALAGQRASPASWCSPIGFVSDHLEVVWDLDNEAAATAAELGLDFARAATPGTDPRFVAMVRRAGGRAARHSDRGRATAVSVRFPSGTPAPVDCCPAPAGARTGSLEGGDMTERKASRVLADRHGRRARARGRSRCPARPSSSDRLRASGKPFLVLTNNSIYTPRDLQARLTRMGFDVPEQSIWTSALATAQFLDDQRPGGTAYVIGEAGLTTALHEIGYVLTDYAPDYVVLGETRTYSFEAITKAVRLINGGARFICTNPDADRPVERGRAAGAPARWRR